ncbi:MAG: macro domain-containing protein [Bacteroidales bacterium]
MIIKEIKGNAVELFLRRDVHLIHGCNCFCNMGAGIAKEVKHKIPDAFKADAMTMKGNEGKLGRYSFYQQEDGRIVFNAYTQFKFWGAGPQVDYDAIKSCFESAVERARACPERLPIVTPLIGAGLAGGDWERIKNIIDKCTDDYPIIVVHFDPSVDMRKVEL